MLRYWDRRRFIRVPASGPIRWQSATRAGYAQLVDVSPGGAGIRMPIRRATQLASEITLEVDLSPGRVWRLPAHARVARRTADEDGQCLVGVEFSPEDWTD